VSIPRPLASQASALPLSYERLKLVRVKGFEPLACRFRTGCSNLAELHPEKRCSQRASSPSPMLALRWLLSRTASRHVHGAAIASLGAKEKGPRGCDPRPLPRTLGWQPRMIFGQRGWGTTAATTRRRYHDLRQSQRLLYSAPAANSGGSRSRVEWLRKTNRARLPWRCSCG
jgi:hypothetical protein